MSLYTDQVLSRAMPWLMSAPGLRALRAQVCAPLAGEVLEIGFGAGLNLPHYPEAVRRVQVVDPDAVGWRLAQPRIAAFAREVVRLDPVLPLPLGDGAVDHVLSTWTMCTVPALEPLLGELRRVLGDDGVLHFVEHGLHPETNVQHWQRRLEPVHRCYAGGCHLTRDIPNLLQAAGFSVEAESWLMPPGPRVLTWMTLGVARRSSGVP